MLTTNYYSSVTNTITDLHRRGFTLDFALLDKRLFCAKTLRFFNSSEFEILEVYSFEDDYLDKEQTVIYAIECLGNAARGILFQNPHHSYKEDIVLKKLRKFWR